MLNRLKKKISLNKIKTISKDLFIVRLRSSVIGEGMLHEGNIYLMDYAIKNMPLNGDIIEIGSHGGLSTNLLLHLMRKYKRTEKFFNCDPWVYLGYNDTTGSVSEMIDGKDDITRVHYMNYIKQSFINSVSLFNKQNLPHTFDIYSDDFFIQYRDLENQTDIFGQTAKFSKKIAFAYIDGDHSYEQSKKDFENVDAFIIKDGFILFDDSIDGSQFGSTKLMLEIKKNKSYRLVDKNPNYLFQKK